MNVAPWCNPKLLMDLSVMGFNSYVLPTNVEKLMSQKCIPTLYIKHKQEKLEPFIEKD